MTNVNILLLPVFDFHNRQIGFEKDGQKVSIIILDGCFSKTVLKSNDKQKSPETSKITKTKLKTVEPFSDHLDNQRSQETLRKVNQSIKSGSKEFFFKNPKKSVT